MESIVLLFVWLIGGAAGLVIDRALVLFPRKKSVLFFAGMPFCGASPAKKQNTFFIAGEPQEASSRGIRESRGLFGFPSSFLIDVVVCGNAGVGRGSDQCSCARVEDDRRVRSAQFIRKN
jgi:hypothetical protein